MGWLSRRRRDPSGHREMLSFDGTPERRDSTCADCHEQHEGRTGFVLRDGAPHAVYFADWYPHTAETFIDVAMGSFGDSSHDDNVVFGCRYGYVDGQDEVAASLVTPLRSADPIMGRALDREIALRHPCLEDLWRVTDWLVLNDDLLHRRVFHAPPRPTAE
jgi:hypothetical protein